MGVTTGPDGIPTITVTPTPQSNPTPNTGSGPVTVAPTTTTTNTGGGAVGGGLPLVSTIQQATNTGSGGGGIPLSSSIQQLANSVTQPASQAASQDMRIRLAPLDINNVIQGVVLAPLLQTAGMIFPYTPTINFTQAVNYMDLQLVHSNTDYPAYTRTPSVTISVSGKFTVQNQAEGAYALACLHFLRTVSKMYFGANDTNAGLPPPVLVFSGYGNYMFGTGGGQGLRVVLKNHNWSFDDSVDSIIVNIPATPSSQPGGIPIASLSNYIPASLSTPANGGAGNARLPSLFTVSLELMVVQTPQRMRNVFSFAKFASGALMQSSTGWI